MKHLKYLVLFVLLHLPLSLTGQDTFLPIRNDTLLKAVQACDYSAVASVLKTDIKVNAVDQHGMSALHYAVICGNPEIVQLLLLHKANAQIYDNKGMLPIDYAKLFEQSEIVGLLLGKYKQNMSA
ncbi:MAG: ankyrin repeat domain-containing protein [Bacteroidota bacterium]